MSSFLNDSHLANDATDYEHDHAQPEELLESSLDSAVDVKTAESQLDYAIVHQVVSLV